MTRVLAKITNCKKKPKTECSLSVFTGQRLIIKYVRLQMTLHE